MTLPVDVPARSVRPTRCCAMARATARHARVAALLLGAVGFGASPLAAGETEPQQPVPATTVAERGESSRQDVSPVTPWLLPGGVLVFVDPATGRILERPRPEQLAALRALRVGQAARAGSAEERRRLLDSLPRYAVPGGFGVDIDGLFPSALVVERQADGSLRLRCTATDHEGHEHEHVEHGPATGSPPEL